MLLYGQSRLPRLNKDVDICELFITDDGYEEMMDRMSVLFENAVSPNEVEEILLQFAHPSEVCSYIIIDSLPRESNDNE